MHRCQKNLHTEPDRRCYTNCRCRCDGCRHQNNVYKQALKLRHGRETVSVPRPTVAAHVRRLLELGATRGGIARTAGVTVDAVDRVLSPEATRPVPVKTARAIMAVTPAGMDGGVHVAGRFAAELCGRLRDVGWTDHQIAVGLGWESWPGRWPGRRVTVRVLRRLQGLVAEAEAPKCVDCGRPPMLDGLRCLGCFRKVATPDLRTDPTWHRRCGTDSGYHRHHRSNEKPCDLCRAAHTQARKDRKERAA
jgi:hypothetical protein